MKINNKYRKISLPKKKSLKKVGKPLKKVEKKKRGLFYKNWEENGLPAKPNVGDNSVHASASPFEALAERMNWIR